MLFVVKFLDSIYIYIFSFILVGWLKLDMLRLNSCRDCQRLEMQMCHQVVHSYVLKFPVYLPVKGLCVVVCFSGMCYFTLSLVQINFLCFLLIPILLSMKHWSYSVLTIRNLYPVAEVLLHAAAMSTVFEAFIVAIALFVRYIFLLRPLS